MFISLGIAVSTLGGLLYDLRTWLAKIGGIVVIIFGLHMTGILRIPFLEYDLRPRSKDDVSRSYFSSAMMGVFFSAGWSPCVGPVLGAILTLAFNGGSISRGCQAAFSIFGWIGNSILAGGARDWLGDKIYPPVWESDALY